KPRAGHQNGIVHFLAQFKSLGSLGVSVVQITHVKVEEPAVFQHAADSVVMVMMAIDLFRPIQVGKGAAAKLLMLPQLAVLLPAGSGCLSALAAFSFRVNLLAYLDGHQTLHIRNVGERARQVSVLRVRLLEMLNGAGEKFQRLLIMLL